jgi:hypothetical protein
MPSLHSQVMNESSTNTPDRDDLQPTVGDSYKVDQQARAIFKEWLLSKLWLPREQDPDFHLDYRIEVVEKGELTGRHFQVQLKGRSINKRKTKRVATLPKKQPP